MNEIQKVMNELGSMIEHKEILIRNQEDEIQFLKKVTKECYNEGLSDGMNKAWSLAQKIVYRQWEETDGIHTVEDWFDMFTAKDALNVMDDLLKKEKPHWKEDTLKNVYECSKCGFASLVRHKFCPECGVKME